METVNAIRITIYTCAYILKYVLTIISFIAIYLTEKHVDKETPPLCDLDNTYVHPQLYPNCHFNNNTVFISSTLCTKERKSYFMFYYMFVAFQFVLGYIFNCLNPHQITIIFYLIYSIAYCLVFYLIPITCYHTNNCNLIYEDCVGISTDKFRALMCLYMFFILYIDLAIYNGLQLKCLIHSRENKDTPRTSQNLIPDI